MWMAWIDQAKFGKEKARLHLQPKGQRLCGQEGFFQLDDGFAVEGIDKKHDVRLTVDIGIYRPSERQFHVL